MTKERILAVSLISLQCILIAEYSLEPIFSCAAIVLALVFAKFTIPLNWLAHAVIGGCALTAFTVEAFFDPPIIQNDWLLKGQFVIAAGKSLVAAQLLELAKRTAGNSLSVRFDIMTMISFLILYCRSLTDSNAFFFLIISVLMVFLFAMYWKNKSTNSQRSNPTTKSRYAWYALFAIGLLIGTSYIADGTKSAANLLRYFLMDEVAQAQQQAIISKVAYSTTGRLNEVTSFQQINPESAAIYVTCEVPPGYLRGRAFTDFGKRGWTRSRDFYTVKQTARQDIANDAITELSNSSLFTFAENSSEPYRSIRVRNGENHLGNVRFTALGKSHLFGDGSELLIDRNFIVYDGVQSRNPYMSIVPETPVTEHLPNQFIRQLTRVPKFIDREVLSVANSLQKENDAETIENIESYFQDNFSYSMYSSGSSNLDRISDLILNQTPSHCEYFATAAAFLLRLNDIPSRYVTGFVVFEGALMDEDNVWVARNKNAHAWVEAYDRQQQRWKTVEPTPGMNAPKSVWGSGSSQSGQFASNETFSEQSESVSNRILAFLSSRVRLVLQQIEFLKSYLNIGISILLVIAFWWIRNRSDRKSGEPQYKLKHRATEMRRIDKRLRKRGFIRQPSETLHQFSQRLQEYEGDDKDWVYEVAGKIRDYATERYQVAFDLTDATIGECE